MTEYIEKSAAIHAVLHNEGQAAVAAVQEIKVADAVPVEFIETLKNNFPNDSVGVFAIDYILMMYRNFGKEQTDETD